MRSPVYTRDTLYPLSVMAALVPWTFFANSLNVAIPSVVLGHQLVSRLSFPRGVIPASNVGVAMFDVLASVVVFVLFAFVLADGSP
jgi:homopolymeric O-antigen transport system permease protein